MSRPRNRLLRSTVLLLLLIVPTHLPSADAESMLHKKAPDFTRVDLRGATIHLHAYRGKTVLLNFWATWCAPCQQEMPVFVAWQQKYQPSGLQIIGVSMDDDVELARPIVAKLGLTYPIVMGDEKLGEQYGGVLGLPATYLIDARGTIRAVYRGASDLHAMETKLRSLMPADSSTVSKHK